MFKPSQTFCILPWTHLFLSVDGHFYPCCRCVDSELPNVNEEGQPYRFTGQTSLEAAWNSEYMKRVRADMINGQRPRPCQTCFMIEDLGVQSDRERLNRLYSSYLSDPAFSPPNDGTASVTFKTFDLRLGNLCNLRCRMCSPRASRSLLQEFVTLYNLSDESKLVKAAKDSDWIDTRILLELFERFAPELDELHFAGGEPFLISAMFDVLRYLVDRGLASRISLAYVSNLTAFPEALRDLWPHFKGVRLSVSLDGHERVNSYIRFPSVWKSLQANLRTVDSDANTLNCKTLRFYTTVQVYNVFSLPDLFDYIFETFSLFDPFPNLIIVQEPSCFDIQVLPQQLKSAITARYHDYIESRSAVWRSRASTSHISEFTTKLEGVIRHMNEFDASFRIPEFVRRTNLHDAYRQQRASELIPELLPLFDMA